MRGNACLPAEWGLPARGVHVLYNYHRRASIALADTGCKRLGLDNTHLFTVTTSCLLVSLKGKVADYA